MMNPGLTSKGSSDAGMMGAIARRIAAPSSGGSVAPPGSGDVMGDSPSTDADQQKVVEDLTKYATDAQQQGYAAAAQHWATAAQEATLAVAAENQAGGADTGGGMPVGAAGGGP